MLINEKLEYIKFIGERIKLQQEVRDRWFKYYLTIAGAIFGTALALINLIHAEDFNVHLYAILFVLCIIMFLIGFCFLMIYINQRKNYLRFFDQMNIVEESVIHDLGLFDDQIHGKRNIERPTQRKARRFGADVFTIWVHIIINSLYAGFASLFIEFIISRQAMLTHLNLCIGISIFILSAVILEKIRVISLKDD
ncbi:MAG: hypothetical protein NT002_09155 [candidate division Zixibacteria bacterium]|nr:hypothetical protein [candidate division Zixibacteria bacterium]